MWVTAEKQGQVTATMFWPGADAEIRGIRPTHWSYYDGTVPNEDRVNKALSWLDLPDNKRPTFITLYFSDIDNGGHQYGPEGIQLDSVIQAMDATIGMLLDGLRSRLFLDSMNLIITSDHGMTDVSRDRVIFLDDYIDLEDVTVVDWSPLAAIIPDEGMEQSVFNGLSGAHPRLSVYLNNQIPERFHYRNHRRITPIVCLAEEGWSITSHEYFNSHPLANTGGDHGFDNQLPSMHGILVADGPAFKDGFVVSPVKNIHIYELICHILKLEPAANDGSLDSVRDILKVN